MAEFYPVGEEGALAATVVALGAGRLEDPIGLLADLTDLQRGYWQNSLAGMTGEHGVLVDDEVSGLSVNPNHPEARTATERETYPVRGVRVGRLLLEKWITQQSEIDEKKRALRASMQAQLGNAAAADTVQR